MPLKDAYVLTKNKNTVENMLTFLDNNEIKFKKISFILLFTYMVAALFRSHDQVNTLYLSKTFYKVSVLLSVSTFFFNGVIVKVYVILYKKVM